MKLSGMDRSVKKELAEALLFEKSNVSKIVKILMEKKWIRVAVASTIVV